MFFHLALTGSCWLKWEQYERVLLWQNMFFIKRKVPCCKKIRSYANIMRKVSCNNEISAVKTRKLCVIMRNQANSFFFSWWQQYTTVAVWPKLIELSSAHALCWRKGICFIWLLTFTQLVQSRPLTCTSLWPVRPTWCRPSSPLLYSKKYSGSTGSSLMYELRAISDGTV